MGPFHGRQKNILLVGRNLTRLKREYLVVHYSYLVVFFQLQFDTATLIIPSFRMIKARGCKQRFKSDQLYFVLRSIGSICKTIVQAAVPEQQHS